MRGAQVGTVADQHRAVTSAAAGGGAGQVAGGQSVAVPARPDRQLTYVKVRSAVNPE